MYISMEEMYISTERVSNSMEALVIANLGVLYSETEYEVHINISIVPVLKIFKC